MSRSTRSAADGEGGTGLVSSLAGIAAFLGFLLLAVQVLVHLYATSVVSVAAFDAARLASGAAGGDAKAARAHGLSMVGGYRQEVRTFDVDIGADVVAVRVVADSPALLPAAFGRVTGIGVIERSVVLRREGFR